MTWRDVASCKNLEIWIQLDLLPAFVLWSTRVRTKFKLKTFTFHNLVSTWSDYKSVRSMISNRRNLLKLNILTHHKMSFCDQKGCGRKSPKCEGKVAILNQQVFVNQERGKKVKMGLKIGKAATHLVEEWLSSWFLRLGLLLHPGHHLSSKTWNNSSNVESVTSLYFLLQGNV